MSPRDERVKMVTAISGRNDAAFSDRCMRFASTVIKLIRQLPKDIQQAPRVRQLEKSATSIGANIAEATSAQSRADFISKFEIALKEARETDYWLRLLKDTEQVLNVEFGKLIGECWQITAILVSSIKTAKKNGGIEEPRLQKGRADSREQN